MPTHITDTIYGSDQKPYAGPIRFSPCGEVRVVSADVVTGEPVDLVIADGELDVTLTEGYYLVRMRGTNDFYIEVPAGDGEYELYELMVVGAATPPVGGGIITTSPQDIPVDDAIIVRLNIAAAGLSDVVGTPLLKAVSALRELTAEEIPTTGGTPVTPGSALEVTYMNLGNRYRAMNGEKTDAFKFFHAAGSPANCQIYVEGWRRSLEGRWRRLWSSPNVRGSMGAGGGTVLVGLQTWSLVQNGDFFAIRVVYAEGSIAPVVHSKPTPADPLYNNDGMSYARIEGRLADGADWTNAPKVTGQSICYQAQAGWSPGVGILGFDQLLSWPDSDSIYYPTMLFSRRLDLGWALETFLGISTRNTARRNLLMGDQNAIWTSDLKPVYPRIVVIHASARADIKAGTSKAEWLAALNNLIEQATNETINAGLAVVVSELPFTDPDLTDADEQHQLNRTADEWMDEAADATRSYGEDQAVWLDAREFLGTERSGGDSGNLWALRPEFDGGNGFQLSRHGITMLAIQIGNGIKRYLRYLQATYSQRWAVRNLIGNYIGDADTVLDWSGWPVTYYEARTTLTANRLVALPPPTSGREVGAEIRIFRPAIGEFTLDIGGLTTLAASQWCSVVKEFSVWKLTAKGSLT